MEITSSDQLTEGTTFVATDGVAARQFEAHLAQLQLAEGRTAWTDPAVLSYRAWTRALWIQHRSHDERHLLTAGQVQALWRRIIEQSPISNRLIGSQNAVRWAIDAAQRLRDWQVDVEKLRPGGEDQEFASFLEWTNDYRSLLKGSGWIDPGEAEVILRDSTESLAIETQRTTIWSDFTPAPGQQRFGERLKRDGYKFDSWQLEEVNARCHRLGLANLTDELRAAGHWAARKLSADPNRRLAIVVPNLTRRQTEISRILDDALGPGDRAYLGYNTAPGFFGIDGEPTDEFPTIGAALTALELLSPRGRFNTFSRWLRSPFFATESAEMDARSRLEAGLRLEMDAQLPFLEAFRSGGLAGLLETAAPLLSQVLAEGVRLIEATPRRTTPTAWVNVWRRLLRKLGWQEGTSIPAALNAWEAALNELTQLTPMVGEISLVEALEELQRILRQPRRSGPMPLKGTFLLNRAEDVGPGYDGIWVTGLTDAHWPASPRPNPVLPLKLQIAHGMPFTTSTESLEHSQKTLDRLIKRSPEVVLSWPAQLHDYSAQPSPLILPYPETSETKLLGSVAPREARRLFGSKSRHTVADPVPPMTGKRLRGGARTLDLQSTCPLKAFLESRLAAKPLETVRRGVNARQRGIAAHRAMELLFGELPTRGELEQWKPAEKLERVERSVTQALGEVFGDARGPLRIEFELEAQRLNAVLTNFLTMDLKRPDFVVREVEERRAVPLGKLELSCRLDRIDVMSTSESPEKLVIIDYKTGKRGTPTDWLRERPRDVQLPLYTLAVEDPVSAAVIALLRPEGVQYKGLSQDKGTFPGRATTLPEGRTWETQLEIWREQLESLAREFAAGDSRVFKSEPEPAEGLFAPVTRIYEQTALATGSLEPWVPE